MIAEFLAYHTANMDKLLNYRPKIGRQANKFHNRLEIFPTPIQESPKTSGGTIEKRYSLQNELMSAVEQGDIVKAEKLLNEEMPFIEKIPDRIPTIPFAQRKT